VFPPMKSFNNIGFGFLEFLYINAKKKNIENKKARMLIVNVRKAQMRLRE